MEIEEIIDLLGEVRNSKYVVKRTLKNASTMAKGFKYYIIELWMPNAEAPLCSVKTLGQYTIEHREEIKSNTEREFLEKVFLRL